MTTGLPANWEVKQSRSHNIPYYFNTATRESSWEPPAGTNADELKTYMAAFHSQAGGNGAASLISSMIGDGRAGAQKIRASHLLVKHSGSRRPSSWKEKEITRSKDEARAILEKLETTIKSGQASLADLALTESDCSSARKGGDLGFFGRGEMQKEFEDVAFDLQPGQISGIVESGSGLHLIQRTA
ncbi:peptidyl-prolyl cis-trans isomerase [Dipodascopsis tothii]|uniref:peptidyl-prolyl cis-trans isomerase n=1 Tax=Dipodascopsis tothii TaxID=44089 RepID=UPI0034CD2484